jgi:glutamine amidotransferase-like uncharacterized protein/N-formylglutamate amidohydrolase
MGIFNRVAIFCLPFLLLTLLCSATEAQSDTLITTQQGELPIIISAPHDGALDVPNAQPRRGIGLEAKPGGFVTARDTGTSDLAKAIADKITAQFNKKPYLVINRAHRKFMDPNRPPQEAYEEAVTQAVYQQYHDFLSQACTEVRDKYQSGLLLDIHGQGSRRDTVFRGTQNGLTVQLLRDRFGEGAHTGNESFFAMLQQRQLTVYPNPLDGKEQAGFTGGFIVRNYGSHTPFAIDAMQLEFGGLYRSEDNRDSAAAAIADAVVEYSRTYLKLTSPPLDKIVFTPQPPETTSEAVDLSDPKFVDVAIYTGDGATSKRAKLVAALKRHPKVRLHDRSAVDIQQGKLIGMEIVLHPGGSGGGQGRALGEAGRTKIRDFIANGGGYIGICAGAYLATCHYEWSLNVLDAHVIDREHWARGTGNVEVELESQGKSLLGIEEDTVTVAYANGPLLGPANNDSLPDYLPLAIYKTEIAKNNAPTGVMAGTTAIACAPFGKGKVICFSCHPESSTGFETMLSEGVDWLLTNP